MDQEGGMRSYNSGRRLEGLGITRRMKGSADERQQHTATGMAEAHVRLTKLSMRKIKAQCRRRNIEIEDEFIGYEAGMAQNLVLSYGGVTPCMAAMGQHPRGFYEFEDRGISGVTGATLGNSKDVFENSVKVKLISTSQVQKAIIEDRFTRANNTRPQKAVLPELVEKSLVDISRPPDEKDDGGWRGPGTLLELDPGNGASIVKWQGIPYLLPLRYIRPHQGLFTKIEYNTYMTSLATAPVNQEYPAFRTGAGRDSTAVLGFMDLVDGMSPGTTTIAGWTKDTDEKWTMRPYEWSGDQNRPRIFKDAQELMHSHLSYDNMDGVLAGTMVKRGPPIAKATYGVLMLWLRADRAEYQLVEVVPNRTLSIAKYVGGAWEQSSFALFYSFTRNIEQPQVIWPEISMIKNEDDDDSFDDPLDMDLDDEQMIKELERQGTEGPPADWGSTIPIEESDQTMPNHPPPPGRWSLLHGGWAEDDACFLVGNN